MHEIDLDELYKWYFKQLKKRFKREHKFLKKIYTMAERVLADTANSFRHWLSSPNLSEKDLTEKNQKILERFIDKVLKAISEVQIPHSDNDITYESSEKFIDGIKKLYATYNQEGKKSLPRFAKKFALEIKEAEMNLKKLGGLSDKVAVFLRKNYSDGKQAENLMKKIPLFKNDINRLAQIKTSIEDMTKKYEDMVSNLKNMEEDLYQISLDDDLQELEKVEREEAEKLRRLRDLLKFHKSFKKMKRGLEKGTLITRGIKESDIKPYLKDPVKQILSEGPKIPHLREVLIKTRIILESEDDPLNLKTDVRNRIIENINQIVTEHMLTPYIEELLNLRNRKEELKKILSEKGLDKKRKELKEKIATLTVDSEHFSNDLNRRKREYKELLEKIASDRKSLEKEVEKETGEKIKLKVLLPV